MRNDNEYRKQLRTEKKARGECFRCANKAEPNKSACAQCLVKMAAKQLATKARRVASGRCRRCGQNQAKVDCLECEECIDASTKRNQEDPETHNRHAVTSARRLRLAAYASYGGRCTCCGDQREQFLTIDHIDGGGNAHREELKVTIYRWLFQNNYPIGFQVLCANCHLAKTREVECPCKVGTTTQPA